MHVEYVERRTESGLLCICSVLCQKINWSHARAHNSRTHDSRTNHSHEHRASNGATTLDSRTRRRRPQDRRCPFRRRASSPRPPVESRIGPKRGFGVTPGKLLTISKTNPYPKSENPPWALRPETFLEPKSVKSPR